MAEILSLSILIVFIPTFFFVSITPGMCMTLAMTMGMSIGFKRTLWMMAGELIGVGIVATCAVIGVATLMLEYPAVFNVFKYVGGAYLAYLGLMMWQSKGKMALNLEEGCSFNVSAKHLALQGFVTAIANPKGWAFFISLLPPFINTNLELVPQLSVLLSLILLLEFMCLLIYAAGGHSLRKILENHGNISLINKVAGSLMVGVGIWLAFG